MANYYKRANGTYCIRVSNGLKNGKQELVSTTYKPPLGASSAAIERGVQEFAQLFEVAVHQGLYQSDPKSKKIENPFGISVEEFIEKQYYPHVKTRLSPNTLRFYRSIIDQLIIPSFGKLHIKDLSANHLQSFIDYMSDNGSRAKIDQTEPLSPASVKRYATVFSSIIVEAYRQKYIDNNPLKDASITYPKIYRKQLNVYSEEEAQLFYENALKEPPMIRAMLLTSLLLGVRRGELVALQWGDFDFHKNCVKIQKSAFKDKGELQKLKPPKTVNSIRTIYFSEDYKSVLLEWRRFQNEQKNSDWTEQDFVFTDAFGNMMSIYAPTVICSDFENRCGLRHLKLHGLRHTCGSLMMLHGIDAETVRNVLGHNSIRTTEIYLHPFDQAMKNAGNVLNGILKKEA